MVSGADRSIREKSSGVENDQCGQETFDPFSGRKRYRRELAWTENIFSVFATIAT